MTPELRTLAEQIVALPGWRWLPGLCVTNADGLRVWLQAAHSSVPGWLPDLTDPATGGVLMGLFPLAKDCVDVRQINAGIDIQSGPLFWLAHYWSQGRVLHTGRGATFGEAIAQIALARGRWA